MFRTQLKKTKNQKIRFEQKAKLARSVKLSNPARDTSRGVVSISTATRSVVKEKALLSVYSMLKKLSKKQGLVWIRPIRIKATTSKGEKRLGKGKGVLTTYNRSAYVTAGTRIFEIGPLVNFSGKACTIARQLTPVRTKLPFRARITYSPMAGFRLDRLAKVDYTAFK